MTEDELLIKAEEAAKSLAQTLKENSVVIALAESCTAGLVSALIAQVPGASGVLWGSFTCYSQDSKVSMLDLDKNELDTYGLVSSHTAAAMAENTLEISGAGLAASVTGIAGPKGDGTSVPIGTVWIGIARKDGYKTVKKYFFEGSRNEVRLQAAINVLNDLDKLFEK